MNGEPFSNFAFKFNLRPYTVRDGVQIFVAADDPRTISQIRAGLPNTKVRRCKLKPLLKAPGLRASNYHIRAL